MKRKFIALSLAALTIFTFTEAQTAYAATGWQNNNGKYYYYNSNGTKKTGWFNPQPSIWYYLKGDGEMQTGFLNLTQDTTYYFSPTGSTLGQMCTGWHEIDGSWYYFDKNNTEGSLGTMHKGWLHPAGASWYYLDTNGKMVTGLYSPDKDHKYYFYENGSNLGLMYTGWKQIDNDWYYFDTSNEQGSLGSAHKGWLQYNSSQRYYFDNNNKMKTGWLEVTPTEKYYFNKNGIMQTGATTIDGVKYTFDSNGILVK